MRELPLSHAAFVHLRVRSCYSLLDSTVRLPEVLERAARERMPAVAIADRANLFAALEFSEAAVKGGVQPIVGCLLPIAGDDQARGNGRPPPPSWLPVLVQNQVGYRNLLKLLSRAYLGGEAGAAPELQLDDLVEHGGGLIALTGGTEGPVGRALASGNRGRAEGLLERLHEAFPGRLYVELMRHGLEVEDQIEPALIDLAIARDLPLVATNDVHFIEAAEWEAHDVLLCIADGAQVGQAERRRLTPEHRFKSAAEMAELFADLPEALANTLVIAQRCAFRVPSQAPILPAFPTDEGQSEVSALRARAEAGLELRLGTQVCQPGIPAADQLEIGRPYRARLDYELGVIEGMNYAGYFLIVADFIQWAKTQGVPVGPGRGSGAGSVAAWALSITDLDPLRHGLLFERFLNPERISMPDFDIDFCMSRRDRVIDYVADRYGRDRVSQIITFGSLAARAVVRDVGRVLGLPYGFVDSVAKLIPFELGITLADALGKEPELARRYGSEDEVRDLIDLAQRLEGLARNAGTHAGGVVIAPSPLTDF